MSGVPCPRCNRSTPDGLLCPQCVGRYQAACARLAVLLPELATTVQRLDAVAKAIVHRAGPDQVEQLAAAETVAIPARLRSREARVALVSHAVPVNLEAVDLEVGVRFTLTTWRAHLHARYGNPARPAGPVCRWWCLHESCRVTRDWGRTVPDAVWLQAAARWVRRDDAGAAIVADVLSAARRVEVMVDRREPEVYVGPCQAPDVRTWTDEDGTVHVAFDVDEQTGRERLSAGVCGTHMFAQLGDRVVRCPACGTEYLIAARREWMLEQVRDVWARPAVIAAALAALDLDLTQNRLDQWISRDKRRHRSCWPGTPCGHIVPVALDSDELDAKGRPVGRPMYRVGDVLDRVEALRAERAAREREGAVS